MSNRKINLLQTVYSGLGGTSSVAFSLIESSIDSKKKINNSILFLGVEKLLASLSKNCRNLKVGFRYINTKNSLLSFAAIKNFFNIFLFLKKKNPDVILIHDHLIFVFYFYKVFKNCKLIHVHHSPDKTKTFKQYIIYIFNSFLADKTILVSKRQADNFLVKLNNFFSIKTKVIINGINHKIYKKSKTIKKKSFIMGMAARFHNDKHQDLLIDLFQNFRHEFYKKKIFIEFAGYGPTLINLKQKVKALGLQKKIKFLGNLNQKEMIDWYSRLDLYVHLSKDETSSTAILQAMSIGLPILASNEGGNFGLRVKKNGLYNMMLCKNDVKDIHAKLRIILKDKVLQKKMSKLSNEIIKTKFNSKEMFKNYFEYF